MVQDGFLKIIAKKEQFQNNKYTSARLQSKKAFRYGLFETRLKLPKAYSFGTWPAFWFLSAKKPLTWPDDGTMDLMV
jgi:beta-glucanase (GH16 family)